MSYRTREALLGSLIDYAGTFPPAALPFEDALKEAAAWRTKGRHPWLMAKMALPLADLKKINPRLLAESGADGSAWLFTALGTPAPSASELGRQVEWDVRELLHCNQKGRNASIRFSIISYETKLPADLVSAATADEAYPQLKTVLDRFAHLTSGAVDLFFELGWDGDWKRSLRVISTSLSDWADNQGHGDLVPGIKIRTGGKYVPTPAEVSEVVVACTGGGLRFKATQGLHHALTRKGALGFINVFGALTLSQVLGGESFGRDEVEACLASTSADDFHFEDKRFGWRDFEIDIEAIEAARARHGGTFGSCSLEEPDQELIEFFRGGK